MFLAQIEDVFVFLIPITALMIPIVAILTYHQRKMAETIHAGQRNALPNADVEVLKREMQELKNVVHQQTIAIDNISRYQLPQTSSQEKYTGV